MILDTGKNDDKVLKAFNNWEAIGPSALSKTKSSYKALSFTLKRSDSN